MQQYAKLQVQDIHLLLVLTQETKSFGTVLSLVA